MKRWRSRRAAVTLTALIAGTSLVGGTLAVPPAVGVEPPVCPEAMPLDDLEAGTMGTGYTVSKGTEPEPFDAEILGVYPDAILPGRDLVIAEVHSPAIDKVGGVWYGMSGSPVFVDDGGVQKLVGAVAWSFSFGPSHIIGLTAGEDMVDLIDYPNAAPARESAGRAAPTKIRLSDAMRRDIARGTDTPMGEVEGSFTQLKMPASVSGLGAQSMKRLQRRLNRNGFKVRLYAGSSVARGETADPTTQKPGSNFAAAFTYGDLTYAGVGTTTFVCDGFAVAFGHPFSFAGATQIGANDASAITIWEDPVFAPFKLATIEGSLGTVDQDRFAGIRADFGEPINTIPITSNTFAENTSRTELGQTDAVNSEMVAYFAPYHAELNVISAMDQFGEGSAETTWTIRGTRADGTPWELTRSDMASDRYYIGFEAVHDIYHMIWDLYYQSDEEIEFTSVDFEQITVRDEQRHYRVAKVLVSKDGQNYRRARRVTVDKGSDVHLRITLDPYQEDWAEKTVDMTVHVPRNARRRGEIEIFGGPDRHIGLVGRAKSFDELLDKMREHPLRNSLNTQLRIGRRVKDESSSLLDLVVRGQKSISVRIRGAGGEAHKG
jgi:hypothetical protein